MLKVMKIMVFCYDFVMIYFWLRNRVASGQPNFGSRVVIIDWVIRVNQMMFEDQDWKSDKQVMTLLSMCVDFVKESVTKIIICSRVIGIEPLSYANDVEMTNWATSGTAAD